MGAHNLLTVKDSNPKMFTPALVLAALVHYAACPASEALAPVTSSHQLARFSSALSYSNGENDGESPYAPLPYLYQRRDAADRRRQKRLRHQATAPSTTGDTSDEARSDPRRKPRRAMPHVQITSNADAATRAGYIIRNRGRTQPGASSDGSKKNTFEDKPRRQPQADRGVRPLRSIRRIVHRSNNEQQDYQLSQIGIQSHSSSHADVHIRNRPNSNRSRLSLTQNPQLDEFLDKPEQLPPTEEERKGARRVTFKATRESSKAIISKPIASLTEYMTQPVSQYSLLSFHDGEGPVTENGGYSKQPRSRRWLVRRLTAEEAQGYIDRSSAEACEDDDVMDESNLFRLAVPLLPLIGWDLTPVIDLEVIPPKKTSYMDAILDSGLSSDDEAIGTNEENVAIQEHLEEAPGSEATASSNWAPLRGIRKRIRSGGDEFNRDDDDSPPAVKIRSLRVSLLSTQEEVKEVMSNNNVRQNTRRGSTMQKEAIDMVSKVEEWLRPHITFEAELSWDDCVYNSKSGMAANNHASSTVTVKSTAITSLTIPKIPSDILRKTVPSAFLVKRLGATLTSQALAICLPRFLRQLEKDYNRWSGIGLSSDGRAERNGGTSPE